MPSHIIAVMVHVAKDPPRAFSEHAARNCRPSELAEPELKHTALILASRISATSWHALSGQAEKLRAESTKACHQTDLVRPIVTNGLRSFRRLSTLGRKSLCPH